MTYPSQSQPAPAPESQPTPAIGGAPSKPFRVLEPPTADHRIIWDIYFSSHVLPVVALADEIGLFQLIEATPKSSKEVAAQLNLSEEWAEILLGALASLQLIRLQDGRFRNGDAARSYLLPNSPYYAGHSLRYFATRDNFERLKRAIGRGTTTPAANTAEGTVYVVRD